MLGLCGGPLLSTAEETSLATKGQRIWIGLGSLGLFTNEFTWLEAIKAALNLPGTESGAEGLRVSARKERGVSGTSIDRTRCGVGLLSVLCFSQLLQKGLQASGLFTEESSKAFSPSFQSA